MSDPAPQREAVLAALERVLAWPEIVRSPQLGRFLSYIVQRTIDGEGQTIKAYSIAVDVFGRSADFDPQADPIVRVQARRLRSLLEDYYRGPGAADCIQIHLPLGRYQPNFVVLADSPLAAAAPPPPLLAPIPIPSRPRTGGFHMSWLLLSVIVLALAIVPYSIFALRFDAMQSGGLQPPSITVMEFQDLANGSELAPQTAGLAIELVTDLEQFGNISVHYGGEASAATSLRPASDYELTGIVRPDRDLVQYSAILTASENGEVVWNHTLAVPMSRVMEPDVLDTVSKSFSLVLGSPRGPLHGTARQLLATATPGGPALNPYLCRVLFTLYRETGGASEARRASDCFRGLSADDRDSAMALAATATLLVEQPLAEDNDAPRVDILREATTRLEQAIARDPVSSFVWEQQARLHEATGALTLARAAYSSAVQLNPASVDALAAYARHLAFAGDLDEAEFMARDAALGSPEAPDWYLGAPTLLALRDGELEQAISYAELYAQSDRELGPILAIMAAQRAGNGDVVNRYLPQVLDVAAFRAIGVLPRLRQRISDNSLMDAIRAALVRAGVPPTALIRAF